jgi:hypothetical protein
MPGYWWECEHCDRTVTFAEVTGCSIAAFIWDKLLASAWDQAVLARDCPHCQQHSLRIAYDFPRRDKLIFRLVHAVGVREGESYLPMMWECYLVGEPERPKFDFKYLNGRNPKGLSKPAILSREQLSQLLSLYRARTGDAAFPDSLAIPLHGV